MTADDPLDWIDRDPLAERWWQFHLANPEIGEALRVEALTQVRAGVGRLRISDLVEVVRDQRGFRINNTHRALYARWLAWAEPELADAFVLRRRKTMPTKVVRHHRSPKPGHWAKSKNSSHVVVHAPTVGGYRVDEVEALCGIWFIIKPDGNPSPCGRCTKALHKLLEPGASYGLA